MLTLTDIQTRVSAWLTSAFISFTMLNDVLGIWTTSMIEMNLHKNTKKYTIAFI